MAEFNIDDILKEVRAMESSSAPQSTSEKPEEVKPATEINQEEKLKAFLSKSHDSDYNEKREQAAQDAKTQIGLLYDGEGDVMEADEIFTVGKKRRAPHALTKNEVLGVSSAPEQTVVFDAVKPEENAPEDPEQTVVFDAVKPEKKVEKAPEHIEVFDAVEPKSAPVITKKIKGFDIKTDTPRHEKINGFNISIPIIEDAVLEHTATFDVTEVQQKVEKEPEINEVVEQHIEEEPVVQEEPIVEEPVVIEEPIVEEPIIIEEPIAVEKTVEVEAPIFEEPEEEIAQAIKIELDVPAPPPVPPMAEITKRMLEVEKDEEEEEESDELYGEVIRDYSSIEDATAVREELARNCASASKKLTYSAILTILIMCVNFLPFFTSLSNKAVIIANIVLVALLLLSDFSNKIGAFFASLVFRSNADSAPAIAVIVALIQNIVLFLNPDSLGLVTLITPAAALVCTLALWGKRVMATRVRDNFELIVNDNVKQVCAIADPADAKGVAGVSYDEDMKLCFDRSVVNVQNFLTHSMCKDPFDKICKALTPVVLLSAVATVLVSLLVVKTDLATAISNAAAVAVLGTPATSLLVSNLPVRKAGKKLREFGGVLTGYDAIDAFCDVNSIAVDAEELFPDGSVELLGMKNFGQLAIDKVLIEAASVAIRAGGPLADVFDKIIEGRRNMLPKVSSLEYEDALGISGVVEGRTLRIGNREMMEKYIHSALPDRSYDEKVLREGKNLVYLSVDDNLIAVFLVKYNIVDEDLLYSVGDLVDSGVTLVVKSCDCNITSSLVSRLFEIPEEMVHIMSSASVAVYEDMAKPAENDDGLLIHNNNMTAFALLLGAAHKLKGGLLTGIAIQTIGALAGFVGAMFLIFSATSGILTTANAVLYPLVVAVVSLILSALRNI